MTRFLIAARSVNASLKIRKAGILFGIAKSFGKAFVIGGLFPSLVFVILNLILFQGYHLTPNVDYTLLKKPSFEFILLMAVPLAFILLALNSFIIEVYEGSLNIQKILFRFFLNKNLNRHKNLYERLIAYKEEFTRTNDDIKKNVLAHAIEQEWKRILPDIKKSNIPMDKRRILPTRMGNIFATIEEYPSVRYGMDGSVYWPRLIPVIPNKYAEIISSENINFTLLLNLSFLIGVFALEIFANCLLNNREWISLLFTGIFLLLFYLFYHFSIRSLITMGELIKACFDLFRYEILEQMKIKLPENIEDEKDLWFSLTNYIVSGEPFYFPAKKLNDQGL